MKIKTVVLVTGIVFIAACGGGGDGGPLTGGTGPVTKSSDFVYKTVTELGNNVNDPAAVDAGVHVASNGLELYFHSNRAVGTVDMDIYVSTRTTKADNWGAAVSLSTINSTADDRAPTTSNDGLTMIFASERGAGNGLRDLYESTRADLNSAWGTPVNLGTVINTKFTETGPSLSADSLSLYFHASKDFAISDTDLYVSKRASVLDPWGTAVSLTILNSSAFDTAPEIASDGLTVYFHSLRAGGLGLQDIWRATRADVNSPWNAPVALSMPVNSNVSDLAPGVSNDWKTLYFSSDISGNRNIWMAVP